MDLGLTGKTVIVTGGASGIGQAIAAGFGGQGARVVVGDIKGAGDAAQALAAQGVDAIGVPLDVADDASIAAAVAGVIASHGAIDVLVNAAGLFRCPSLFDTTREDWAAIDAVNVSGLFMMLQAAARHMAERGSGAIVNIASVGGRRGDENAPVYCASKASVISITQSAALALVKKGVRVNAIAPGQIETPLWSALSRDMGARFGIDAAQFTAMVEGIIPAGRLGQPGDLVGTALFLASPMAGFLVGQTINVDGGVYLS
ncbi:SDR family NAD(P)-dependent oxidoreductase [Croceicoccus mobilis]|uniref:Sorbitol dehydrogenase n=1 Tax=Croceicoccus mobilis TaxID=1703339 RepID=A0A916Z8N7_9SPHN|nr:SDR family oxidoreductase [Croceicoccus mobilis]GGD80482.1 sorbitol dehydrogenase [Croceicoccus mobilis]